MSAKKPAARVKEQTSHTSEKGRKRPAEAAESTKVASHVMDSRSSKDRRGVDRREASAPVAVERRGGERRAKVNRRRQIDPTTCEREYNDEEILFMQALESYKRTSGRMFPTCSEVLEVLVGLGYEKRKPSFESTVTGSNTLA